MKDFIIKLRHLNGLSQEDFSKKIGISRPTLVLIEKGERDINLGELRKISELFDIPVEIIMDEEFSVETKVGSQKFSEKALKKFHNLILQCIKYGGAKIDGKITKTKLAKLVYLCDFASYYNFLSPISGFEYKRLPQGPVAIEFFDIIEHNEEILVEQKGKAAMISLVEQPDDTVLNKEEMKLVKDICGKWQGANTMEIVDFTHKQLPWSMCRDRELIPYELINMEEPENVY